MTKNTHADPFYQEALAAEAFGHIPMNLGSRMLLRHQRIGKTRTMEIIMAAFAPETDLPLPSGGA